MGRIEADIALQSWLFGFRPCLALFGTGTVYPTRFSKLNFDAINSAANDLDLTWANCREQSKF